MTRRPEKAEGHKTRDDAKPGTDPRAPVNGSADPRADTVSQSSKEPGQTEPASRNFFGHTFKEPRLLSLALTHRSLAYEAHTDGVAEPGTDNEQLEFTGDAVPCLVVAEALFRRFPNLREGDLTRLRASLVSSRNLALVALRMDLGSSLRLGRGEQQSGGHKKPALLANALEAVIAALYLDGGLSAAQAFIHRHIIEPAEPGMAGVLRSAQPFSGAVGDYKSALQEHLQGSGCGQPKYVLTAQSGPDHQKLFRVEVQVGGPGGRSVTLAGAEGNTKKQAQQEAARLAFLGLVTGVLTPVSDDDVPAVSTPESTR